MHANLKTEIPHNVQEMHLKCFQSQCCPLLCVRAGFWQCTQRLIKMTLEVLLVPKMAWRGFKGKDITGVGVQESFLVIHNTTVLCIDLFAQWHPNQVAMPTFWCNSNASIGTIKPQRAQRDMRLC